MLLCQSFKALHFDFASDSSREVAIKMAKKFEDAFCKQKLQSLSGIDNSKKGSVDLPILDLVNLINQSNDFFTTSSCSGRIAVISEGQEKKKGCEWIFMSHEETNAAQIIASIEEKNNIKNATLKYESFVLHAQCRSLEKAQEMLQAALQAGFRNSGLVIGKKKRIMLYITKIVQICNEKLEENFKRIERFLKGIKPSLSEE